MNVGVCWSSLRNLFKNQTGQLESRREVRPVGAPPYRTIYDFYLSFPLLQEIIIQLSQLNP